MPARLLPVIACALAACASGAGDSASGASPAIGTALPGQLAAFAGSRVVVFPAQMLPVVEPADWRPSLGETRSFLVRVDSAFETALADRGLGQTWVFPPSLQRSARRNPTYLVDPYVARVGPAIAAAMRQRDATVDNPAAGQVRALAGVSDARFALVPLEIRIDSAAGTGGSRAVARFALLDTWRAQVVWSGEAASDPLANWSFALVRQLATRLADLVVPR